MTPGAKQAQGQALAGTWMLLAAAIKVHVAQAGAGGTGAPGHSTHLGQAFENQSGALLG